MIIMGDEMKNIFSIIIAVIFAITIGCFFINNDKIIKESGDDIKSVGLTIGEYKAFQVGAFTDYEKAKLERNNINGCIDYDGNYYYVYYSVLGNSINIERMIKYLNDKHIYFYLKTVNVSDEFKNGSLRYEEVMNTASSDVAFLEINNKLIELYGGY